MMRHDPSVIAVVGGIVVCVVALVCHLFWNSTHEPN